LSHSASPLNRVLRDSQAGGVAQVVSEFKPESCQKKKKNPKQNNKQNKTLRPRQKKNPKNLLKRFSTEMNKMFPQSAFVTWDSQDL
jgi:hypothetical protein